MDENQTDQFLKHYNYRISSIKSSLSNKGPFLVRGSASQYSEYSKIIFKINTVLLIRNLKTRYEFPHLDISGSMKNKGPEAINRGNKLNQKNM